MDGFLSNTDVLVEQAKDVIRSWRLSSNFKVTGELNFNSGQHVNLAQLRDYDIVRKALVWGHLYVSTAF